LHLSSLASESTPIFDQSGQDIRRVSRRVGSKKQESSICSEQVTTQIEHLDHVSIDVPHLSAGSPAIGGWVDDDSLVAFFSA
jgi:hypothetical protein